MFIFFLEVLLEDFRVSHVWWRWHWRFDLIEDEKKLKKADWLKKTKKKPKTEEEERVEHEEL